VARRHSRKDKLRFAVIRYIEAELMDYPENKKVLEELKLDIIESAPTLEDVGGNSIHTTNRVSDPTYSKTARLVTNRRIRHLERTINAIERVLNMLDRDKYRLVELTYWDRKFTPLGVADELHISKSTYYNWREDIIKLLAVEMGLVNAADL